MVHLFHNMNACALLVLLSCGIPVVYLWYTCGIPVVYLWYTCGIPVVYLW